ncbi:hypothetical protein BKA64DRAFT_8550 [Cadophora sp. MPI-SDFR-AT-0126]|nr:hypothetical protein BKA64DRAFT_8550 [Leotiomycetes sp. MPI-SDFR-AT-0126]
MSSSALPAMSNYAPQFPASNPVHWNLARVSNTIKLPSVASIPIRIKRDRVWLKIDGALNCVVVERKRKACSNAAQLSPNKRRRLHSHVREQAEALMYFNTSVESLPIAETMPVSAVVKSAPVVVKSDAVESKSVTNLVPSTKSIAGIAQSTIRGRAMIKCRVTGYPRLRQKMDDFEGMWNAKDVQRWDSWCEKSRDKRCPVEGYEEGDSDCEWEEFKAKRR